MAKPMSTILRKLRSHMSDKRFVTEAVQAYIVPTGDAHQSEYIAECHKRRELISGFSGSAGTVIVTDRKAALWTDGRYFLQAEAQLDQAHWTLMRDGLPETPKQEEWLAEHLPSGSRIGIDPFLISLDTWQQLSKTLGSSGLSLVQVEQNLVDVVWAEHDQPLPPSGGIFPLDISFAGKSWQDKVRELRETLRKKKAYALVVTALDEIAWLFNLRGNDIVFNPVFIAYALVSLDSVSLFIDEGKIDAAVSKHLGLGQSGADNSQDIQLTIRPYNEIQDGIKEVVEYGGKVWISSQSSVALTRLLPQSNYLTEPSPIGLSKAIKNEVEIEGMKQAHIRDAVALCEYLVWLEQEVPKDELTEITGADKLEELRKEQENFVSLSFATISGVGSNGAIIHYHPSEETDRVISKDDLYLCDSGAQYKDGTTDVTRTVHFGTPTTREQECFTRVLKGHIALATAVFPNKITGHRLDTLARLPLWEVGLDYLHGTGHGVGAFLNVHEGPHGIGWRHRPGEEPIQAGMFVTNEPGYYEDGKFGIRIENVMLVKPVELENNFKDRGYLGLEHITLFPIQTKMLIPSMLTQQEIDWLNSYHELCAEKVGAALREQGRTEALNWLLKETRPLG